MELESATPEIFAGHKWDEQVDLYDAKARWLNPSTQRFLSEDPMGPAGGHQNLYIYASGDPVSYVDPDGQFVISGTLTLGAIALSLGGFGAASFYAAADRYDAAGELIGQAHISAAEQAELDRLLVSAGRYEMGGRLLGTAAFVVAAAPVAAPLYSLTTTSVAGLGGGTGLQLAAGATVVGTADKIALDTLLHALGVDDQAFSRYSTNPGATALDFGVSIATAGLFNGYDDVARLVTRRTGAPDNAGPQKWFNFLADQGGETVPTGYGAAYGGKLSWANRLGLRQGYSTTIRNFDSAGSWFARTDTAVHEGFHAIVAKHLPSVWKAGDTTLFKIPVGAPIKYVEEVFAYAAGHGEHYDSTVFPSRRLKHLASCRQENPKLRSFLVSGDMVSTSTSMTDNRLRLWWKSFCSQEVRSAKSTVAKHFAETRQEFTLLSIRLADACDNKFVFLVFFRRSMPSRPTPFLAYEYAKDSGRVTELPEAKGNSYRPKAYK